MFIFRCFLQLPSLLYLLDVFLLYTQSLVLHDEIYVVLKEIISFQCALNLMSAYTSL